MGAYLSTPNTEKFSSDRSCKNFSYGASCMQGWRMSQEDAHNCLPEFDEEKNVALFAVYDGHGGAEVAQYCASKLPNYIKDLAAYKNDSFDSALEEAFLGFDLELTKDEVIHELKVLAKLDDLDESFGKSGEDGADSASGGMGEADVLQAEANMPLEELLKKYEGFIGIPPEIRNLRKAKKDIRSPMVRPKKSQFPNLDGSDVSDKNNSSSDNNTEMNSGEADTVVTQLQDKLANGHAENENNLNMEKELNESQRQAESSTKADIVKQTQECDSCTSSDDVGESASKTKVDSSEASSSQDVVGSYKPSSSVQSSNISSSGESCKEPEPSASSSCKLDSLSEEPGSSSCSSSNAQCSSVSGGSSSNQEPASSSSSQSGSSGSLKKKSKVEDGEEEEGEEEEEEEKVGAEALFGASDEEDDSSEDENVEFDSEDDDDEEDDSDEEEEDEDIGEDNVVEETNGNEEPGSDSGCTAVLALLKDRDIYVANAGDSRCVLCRNGNAIDLSFDHKPEDDIERKRIEAAGGKITADGRVNGGLNLSRAFGDHFYKRNKALPPKSQMVIALPDIQTATLQKGDEFLVLACDGIWNYMSSQEVVDFIREKLKDPEKRQRPSLICEQIFDYCLAPNTLGDGTGCDNMTCIIITFEHLWNTFQNKRTASELDTNHEVQNERPPEKRPKIEHLVEGEKVETPGKMEEGELGT